MIPYQIPNEIPNEIPNQVPNQVPNVKPTEIAVFKCYFEGQGVSVDPSLPVRDIELMSIRIRRCKAFENPTSYKEMAAINMELCLANLPVFQAVQQRRS